MRKESTAERSSGEIRQSPKGTAELETVEGPMTGVKQWTLENERGYRYLLDHSTEIILVLNKRGKIVFTNKRTLDNFGFSKEELIGKSITHFLTKESVKKALYALAQEFLGRPQPELEVQAKTKSGGIRYLSVAEGSASIHKNGKLMGIMISANDITERRKAEKGLRESENQFRELWEEAPVAYHTVDTKAIITNVNQTESNLFGYPKDELVGKSIFEFILPEQRAEAQNRFQQKISGKPVPRAENRIYIKKDGSKIHAVVDNTLQRDSDGNIIGLRTTITDVTKLKQAEEAFQRRNAQLELVHYIQSEVPINSDLETILSQVAESIGQSFGYYKISVNLYDRRTNEIEYLTGWNKTGLLLPRGHRQKLGQGLIGRAGLRKKIIVANDVSKEPDYLAYHLTETKAELVIPLIVQDELIGVLDLQANQVNAFSEEDVSVLQAVANYIAQVIDEKQRAEALRESEERFHSVVEHSYEGIFIVDNTYRISYANTELNRISGFSREEIIGQDFRIFLADESKQLVQDHYIRRQRGENVPSRYEFDIIRKDGEKRRVEISSTVIKDSRGNTETMAQILDITERKLAEEALRESEEKFRNLAEQSPNMIFINKKGSVVYANRKCEEITGYTKEEICSPDFDFLSLIVPEFRDKVKTSFGRHSQGEDVPPFEYMLLTKDGKRIAAIQNTKLIDYEKVNAILGTITDISERKGAEEALRESEAKLKIAQALGRIGNWEFNLDNQSIQWSDQVYRLYERDPAKGPPDAEEEADYYAPEQVKKLREYARLAAEQGRAFEYDLEVRLPSGRFAHFAATMRPCRDESGHIVKLFGTVQDISERKRAEEELRNSEERLKLIFEYAPDAYYLNDLKGNFIDGNKAAEKLLGYKKNELLGKSFLKLGLLSLDQIPKAASLLAKNALGRPTGPDELVLKRKDESDILVEISTYPVKIEGKTLVLGIARDITERKRVDNELRKTTANLRKLLGGLINVIATTVEVRDPYTSGHQKRVANLARAIATEMALPKDKIEGIRVVGVIHDIGKISVPAEILSKPGKLSEIEFALIKSHAQIGYEILKEIEFPWPVAQIVHQHHERMDGSGYPRGLKGKDILLEARILAIADVVEAMAGHRPYRPTLGIDKALEEITLKKGILYDPEAVDACLKIFSDHKFKFVM